MSTVIAVMCDECCTLHEGAADVGSPSTREARSAAEADGWIYQRARRGRVAEDGSGDETVPGRDICPACQEGEIRATVLQVLDVLSDLTPAQREQAVAQLQGRLP